ncbi:MAG: hypothetical protein ACM3O4_02580 [Ignavibacteriales bacterium]
MKKLFLLLVFLFLVYFAIQFAFNYFGNGHEISYDLKDGDTTILVNEKYVTNYKDEISNYYFNVTVNDKIFSFQTFHDFNRNGYVLKEVKYYNDDEYDCILPIFKGNTILFDVMCLKDDLITYYHNIHGNEGLNKFVNDIPLESYKVSAWNDSKESSISEGTINLYKDNMIKDHFIGVTYYRGIYTINKNNTKGIFDLGMFVNDAYQRKVEGYVNNYYVTANYDNVDTISKFYYTDIKANKLNSIQTYYEISFNSYIQGTVDDSLYLFDIDHGIQYEINTAKGSILEVGNKDTKIRHLDKGKWVKVTVDDILKYKPLFTYDDYSNTNYARADKEGNKLSGYYYFYKKVDDHYEVYRANIQNEKVLTYLFDTKNIDRIVYVKDYIYFIDGNDLKYFSDQTGVKTLLTNSEYEFNKNLSFNVLEAK